MKRTASAFLVLFALLVGTTAAPIAETSLPARERAALIAVIKAQLDAFRRDDGATAYAQASPLAQRRFPSVDVFMRMVRRGYKPLYRSRETSFGRTARAGTSAIQEVRLTGPDDRRYQVLYQMAKQPDGSWKIDGVLVRPEAGRRT